MPWDPHKIAILERAWEADAQLDRIAEMLYREFSTKRISSKARELGLPPRRASWTARDEAILRRLWSDGFSSAAIGRQLNPPRDGKEVRRYAAQIGLPPRGVGEVERKPLQRSGPLDEAAFGRLIQRAALGVPDELIAAEFDMSMRETRALIDGAAGLVAETRLRLNTAVARLQGESTLAAVLQCLEAAGDTIRPPEGEEMRWWCNWRHCGLADLVRRANTWRSAFGLPGFDVEAVLADAAKGGTA